ncbi:retron Eco8 family effector endonuclease [Klebsiella pneumoniae]|uniref:retron Eco8 family effector endonuclease n=1 Tax=Klebsiella pneumoniae TaxID=573 RepID=UPI00211757D0|nr:retron Eco8 family effector endonuclease [Klebsiella pneumoniae]MCQ8397056.1 retron Eco8 family effector endonuclease [Klebsiella pneumoniae]
MTIESIRVKNLLSFDDVILRDFRDINCIIGRNNVGKSNLLKVIRYFYAKLENKKVIPLDFHTNYNAVGEITFTFDTTRIKKIVTSRKNNGRFHKHIYNTLFKSSSVKLNFEELIARKNSTNKSFFSLTLTICKDDSVMWSVDDPKVRSLLATLYPFLYIETRHIDLYDWNPIWKLISNLNSFNFDDVDHEELVNFLDEKISSRKGDYKKYIDRVVSVIDTKPYTYKEKVINYIKVAIKGDSFVNAGEELFTQSDGTNSNKFLETLLHLLITLTRTEFISPIVYIDEPEVGLHPKLAESFVSNLNKIYSKFKKTSELSGPGRYKTPYPNIFYSTHSPSILKQTIKLFGKDQQVLHFSKKKDGSTRVNKINSTYSDERFLNIFSDNEARLFFSEYIVFVEGATELELFRNLSLLNLYPSFSLADIYDANEVILANINPGYSKASIPFVIIKDIDTLIDYSIKTEKFSLRPLFEKMIKELTKEFDYYDTGFGRVRKEIDLFSDIQSSTKKNIDSGLFFKRFSLHNLSSRINKVSRKLNRYFMTTTIEGALINEQSLPYFFNWIGDVILTQMTINNPNPDKFIEAMRRRYNIKSQVVPLFKSIFCIGLNHPVYSSAVDKQALRIKLSFLNYLKRKVYSDFNNEKEIVLALRLAFGGKTETQYTLDKLRKDGEAEPFREKIKNYKNNELFFLEPQMTKTSGWVTTFLNYTIEKITSEESDDDRIRQKLSFIFPEIISIIEQASSSIEAEESSLTG